MGSRDWRSGGGLKAIRGGKMGGDEYRIWNVPRVSVYRAAAGNIAAATPSAITWDTIEYDTDSMFNPINPTILSANTPGLYELTCWGNLANAGDTTYRQFYFFKNGANALGQVTGSLNGLQWACCSTIRVSLNKGDTVSGVFAQGSAGALAFAAATAATQLNGFQACLVSTIG